MLAGPRRRAPRAQEQRAPRAQEKRAPRAGMQGAKKSRMLTRLTGLLVLSLLATGCDGVVSRGGFPSPITTEGENLLGVWRGSLIAAGCVGVFVIGLILYAAVFYRRRSPDELPRQVRYNLPIEILYTIVPVIMVAVLFYFTAIRENDTDHFDQPADLSINVVGFQWNWQFNYVDDGLSVTGRPGQIPELVLPVGETVRFYETSPDVIHSFWVIPFLFKRDVVPGRTNSFQVTLTHTGTFKGKCTEYCGVDHDRMLFAVRVLPQSDYETWLSGVKATAETGANPMFSVYEGDDSATFDRNTTNGSRPSSNGSDSP